jgi:hypothetical protein
MEKNQAKIELAKRILAKRSFLDFVVYMNPWFKVSWHHKIIAHALERVEKRECKRLMIFLPPRHSKSEMGSVNFPAWFLGRNKDKNIIEASYSDELASEFGRQARNIVDSPEYKNIFDTKLSPDSKSKSSWATNGLGRYSAVGIGGSVTGKGADVFLIDDPIKNRADAESQTKRDALYSWYKSTARTRLSPDGAIVLLVTRWSDDDLAGTILAGENGEDWEVISLPAIAVEDEVHRKKGEALWATQFSVSNLLNTKGDIGLFEWSALYQQNPINSETQEFKKSHFKYATEDEVNQQVTSKFITIDPAVKEKDTADYTGITINRVNYDNDWYIKSMRKHIDSAKLVDLVFELWENEKPETIGIEETTYFNAIEPFMRQEMIRRNKFPIVYPLKHGGVNKNLRIRSLLPRYEAGKIYHLIGQCETLEEQLMRFPKGKNDDEPDALAYQEQVVQAPIKPLTMIEQARYDMGTDTRTGYLI